MDSGSTHILCVGFNGGIALARERALSCAGFRVSAVASPLKAITSARQSSPQVVIVDDQEIDDWRELADCLVIASSTVKVIVLVNAPAQLSTTIAALLSKPISPEGLVQAVQAVLRENTPKLTTASQPNASRLATNPQN